MLVRALHVRDQEAPGVACEVVGQVEPDVRAPDHRHARRDQPRDHPRGLRVVQQHDVGAGEPGSEQLGLGRAAALIDRSLPLAQLTAVVGAVQAIVEPLGDAEEVVVAADHRPASVDAGAADVSDQRPQHLRHPAALRRRVHGPQRASVQQLTTSRERALELRERLGREHLPKALGSQRRDRHLRRALRGCAVENIHAAPTRAARQESRRSGSWPECSTRNAASILDLGIRQPHLEHIELSFEFVLHSSHPRFRLAQTESFAVRLVAQRRSGVVGHYRHRRARGPSTYP